MSNSKDKDFWKKRYQDTWDTASSREKELAYYIYEQTGMKVIPSGLGAESNEFIHGSASDNGYEKGDADLNIEGTNVYLEVTGPLQRSVKKEEPLWFRPDKIENAKKNSITHTTFLLHNCPGENLWRVVRIDKFFLDRYENNKYEIVKPRIRGSRETYVKIPADDVCVKELSSLINYIDVYIKKRCPICGSPLARKTAKSGYFKGKGFWGCKSFPECKYRKNYREIA